MSDHADNNEAINPEYEEGIIQRYQAILRANNTLDVSLTGPNNMGDAKAAAVDEKSAQPSISGEEPAIGALMTPIKGSNFPTKLRRILSNPKFQEFITWLPHGRSWRILKPKAFEAIVIPLYFHHAKYASFMRQVNGWGFQRMTQGLDHNSYYHNMFVREYPDLSIDMRRLSRSKQSLSGNKLADPINFSTFTPPSGTESSFDPPPPETIFFGRTGTREMDTQTHELRKHQLEDHVKRLYQQQRVLRPPEVQELELLYQQQRIAQQQQLQDSPYATNINSTNNILQATQVGLEQCPRQESVAFELGMLRPRDMELSVQGPMPFPNPGVLCQAGTADASFTLLPMSHSQQQINLFYPDVPPVTKFVRGAAANATGPKENERFQWR